MRDLILSLQTKVSEMKKELGSHVTSTSSQINAIIKRCDGHDAKINDILNDPIKNLGNRLNILEAQNITEQLSL